MSISPSVAPSPENPEKSASTNQPSRLPMILLIVVLVAGFGGLFYYASSLSNRLDQVKGSLENSLNSQGETLQKLSLRLDQTDGRTAELEGQFTVTRERLGMTEGELRRAQQIAAQLSQQQKEAVAMLSNQSATIGQLQQEQVATKGSVGSLSGDVVGVKEDVKSTKEELAATKAKLQSVVGDLGVQSDLVAHNRTELEELKRLGTRDYIEFNLAKNKRLQRIGMIQLELKKADVKRQKYTVNLVVDDKTIEKKDKTVYEPVQFYQEGYVGPTEIVVNQVQKDRIVGYVSVPKKKEARAPMGSTS
ncbi:MAG: hypothetical protein HY313_05355 [Acidobacteria bacterium]|nr:hypothetical protein [Acidobacteriota bacterium]